MVKPIPEEDRKKWHGKSGKESFARPHSLEVLLDSATGKYATGLTEKDIEYLKSQGCSFDLSDTYDPVKAHTYWGSNAAKIKLPNHTMILDESRIQDYIKIRNLKASKFVANSLKDWQEGLYPEATHIIYDEREEVEVKATKIQQKNKAIGMILKMSLDDKTNVVRLLSDASVKGRSQDFIDVEVDKIINDPEKLDQFFDLFKMPKEEFVIRAQILEGIHRRILTKEGPSIFYMGEKLGFDMEETVKYFLDPNNQQVKITLLEKLTA